MSFLTTVLAALKFRASAIAIPVIPSILYRAQVDAETTHRARVDAETAHRARVNTATTHRVRVDVR